MWWVYVIQSGMPRVGKRGKPLPGFFYVGCTTDPVRRLRQHNGEIVGGAKYTAQYRPWEPRAVYGPYRNQSEAMKAERALKKKRGITRTQWTAEESPWCWGPGPGHPWVSDPLSWPEPSPEELALAEKAPVSETPSRGPWRRGRKKRTGRRWGR